MHSVHTDSQYTLMSRFFKPCAVSRSEGRRKRLPTLCGRSRRSRDTHRGLSRFAGLMSHIPTTQQLSTCLSARAGRDAAINHGHDESEWSAAELTTLMEAHRDSSPGAIDFWELIAQKLPGRSAHECAAQYYAENPSPPRPKRSGRSKPLSAPLALQSSASPRWLAIPSVHGTVNGDADDGYVGGSPWRSAKHHGGNPRDAGSLVPQSRLIESSADGEGGDGTLRKLSSKQRVELNEYARKSKVRSAGGGWQAQRAGEQRKHEHARPPRTMTTLPPKDHFARLSYFGEGSSKQLVDACLADLERVVQEHGYNHHMPSGVRGNGGGIDMGDDQWTQEDDLDDSVQRYPTQGCGRGR